MKLAEIFMEQSQPPGPSFPQGFHLNTFQYSVGGVVIPAQLLTARTVSQLLLDGFQCSLCNVEHKQLDFICSESYWQGRGPEDRKLSTLADSPCQAIPSSKH